MMRHSLDADTQERRTLSLCSLLALCRLSIAGRRAWARALVEDLE